MYMYAWNNELPEQSTVLPHKRTNRRQGRRKWNPKKQNETQDRFSFLGKQKKEPERDAGPIKKHERPSPQFRARVAQATTQAH